MRKEETAKKCSMPKNIVYWGTKTQLNSVIKAAKKRSFIPRMKYFRVTFSLCFS
jgi:hypothetical protein